MVAVLNGPPLPTPSTPPTVSTDDIFRFWLGIIIICQFVALIIVTAILKYTLPDSQLILGAEISFVSIVLNYFFGSSSGSKSKSDLIAQITNGHQET